MNLKAKEPTLLLVEDSNEDILLFRMALAQTGIKATVLIASNGKAAIDVLSNPEERQRLDMVFLDLKMPMVSGFDVLRWIQQQTFQPPLRIVVLSGSFQEEDKALAQILGACDYVVKPIRVEDLRQRLVLLTEGAARQE